MKSLLLDRGREEMLIYPEVTEKDSRGNMVQLPSTTPVPIRVTTSNDRSSNAELNGQVDVEILRCLTRTAPVGTWARVHFRGQDWDLAKPPRFAQGVSEATRHVHFTIRSRNKLGKPRG